jgi:uncharacterized protein (TIGR02001 family)
MKVKSPGMGTAFGFGVGFLLLALTFDASAGFSGTVTLTSDYDYRGYSQTAGDFAIQGSVDYEHDSGFYASAWGSSLDWGSGSDANIEIDYIVGFSRDIGDSGVAWDVGLLFYTYPGLSSANFVELYGGFSWSYFNVKLSYSDDFAGLGASAWYLDGGAAYDWDNGFSVFAYAGYSFGDAFESDEGLPFGAPDYYNYGIGAGYSIGDHVSLEIKAVGTNQDGIYRIEKGVFENDFRGIAAVTVSFP